MPPLPPPTDAITFAVLNIQDHETVHQTCLLVKGQCTNFEASEEGFISAKGTDGFVDNSPHAQRWPVAAGKWQALLLLSPGSNFVHFKLHHADKVSEHLKIVVNYVPLLQLPPLHLAIMVAKDSPLLIDCPSSKQGAISSTHSSLNAAIAKFRTTAYMWQALTAEDMRQKGLGRRCFRLEEEWNVNTTTQQAFRQFSDAPNMMGTVAKVHIVRTEKTVAELRDRNYAQQNSTARDPDAMHKFFEDALRANGGPFASNNRPVVAGMILDSSFCIETNLIHAHAALGCHKANGLSLGVFGSHLTYSWPRFFEEIPACLVDCRSTDDTVGNDNGECNTLQEACFVGQGAFLHEVGHAFGADHTTGIMARGYSKHWPRNFLAGLEEENDAKWDLQDALRFRVMPHFRLPEDGAMSKAVVQAAIDIKPTFTDEKRGVVISSAIGLARIEISYNGNHRTMEVMNWQAPFTTYSIEDIDKEYDRSKSLSISVLAMNGKQRTLKDVWRLLKQTSFMHIPGCDFQLRKQSVRSDSLENNDDDDDKFCEWAMLLHEKGEDGKVYRATAIDLRVGCTMDGAVVYYADGHRTNCGPAKKHHFGGHASEKQDLPKGNNIIKVEVRRCTVGGGWGSLHGIRMTLDDGTRWGELHDVDSNDYYEEDGETVILEPSDGERIVGFFGQSAVGSGFCFEFGIIAAPVDRDLPSSVYDMKELRNTEDDAATPGSESELED